MKIPGTGRLRPMIRRAKKQLASSKGLILMYHRVADVDVDPWALSVSPQHFDEQLEVLKSHYHPLSLQQLVQAHKQHNIPKRAVAITFDDGYADNLLQAKPILERHNIPATVFVITGTLGNSDEFWWDALERLLLQPGRLPQQLTLTIDNETHHWDLGQAAYYSEADYQHDRTTQADAAPPGSRMFFYYSLWQTLLPLPEAKRRPIFTEIVRWAGETDSSQPKSKPNHRRTLHPQEVALLNQGDLIEIGAHTITHPFLSAQPLAAQQSEIERSKATLEALINQPVTSFSYPFGDRSADTVSLTQAAGFNCACTTAEDIVWRKSNGFELPRVTVQNWNKEDFSRKLEEWFHG